MHHDAHKLYFRLRRLPLSPGALLCLVHVEFDKEGEEDKVGKKHPMQSPLGRLALLTGHILGCERAKANDELSA